MLYKLPCCGGMTFLISNLGFENGVILYGSQTGFVVCLGSNMFENGVILYGSQTMIKIHSVSIWFENGVILYGSQTKRKGVMSL